MKDALFSLAVLSAVGAGILCVQARALATGLKDLPEPDKELANTVDPWGVPFSDSLRRWDEVFAKRWGELGATHAVVAHTWDWRWDRVVPSSSPCGWPSPATNLGVARRSSPRLSPLFPPLWHRQISD